MQDKQLSLTIMPDTLCRESQIKETLTKILMKDLKVERNET